MVKLKFNVRCVVRDRGAQGQFFPLTFTVYAPAFATREQMVAAWQAEHGEKHELNRLLSFSPA